jgi:hypothetical protein
MPNTTARVIAHLREVDTPAHIIRFSTQVKGICSTIQGFTAAEAMVQETLQKRILCKTKAAAVPFRDAERVATFTMIRASPANRCSNAAPNLRSAPKEAMQWKPELHRSVSIGQVIPTWQRGIASISSKLRSPDNSLFKSAHVYD